MIRILRVVAAAALVSGTCMVVAASGVPACASSNIFFVLGSFPPGASRPSFYYAAEDQGSTSFMVRRTGDDCDATLASVAYDVESGSAIPGDDYASTSGRTVGLGDPGHDARSDRQTISVGLLDDVQQESVERATVVLSDPREESSTPRTTHLGSPSSAPLYLIDDEGSARFSFGDPAHSQSERSTSVALPVFRSGDASGAETVSFVLEPGSASPEDDYVAPATGTLNFAAGERLKLIAFSLVDDNDVETPETIEVSLSGNVVTPTSMTVTIENDDVAESVAPSSRLHHPKQGRSYPPDQFNHMGVHILTQDNEGGSGVVKAQFALRKTMVSGACAWWTRAGFQGGPCDATKWLRGRVIQQGLYYVSTIKRLRPSVGTNIKSYKMWCRAYDGAGNVETSFEPNRNANSFEVTRR